MKETNKHRVKILTVCSAGLIRSVALAHTLKQHFEPVDVIPMGSAENKQSKETKEMLCKWADHIIIMQPKYKNRLPIEYHHKIKVCDVGTDIYGNSRNKDLVSQCWKWIRTHTVQLGITEHNKKL